MAKKKLSDVNTVAQISDNDFITSIMSNGEVVKVRKSNLYPVATTLNDGLMSTSDRRFIDQQTMNILNTNNSSIDTFYITGLPTNAGSFTDIMIMAFDNPARATLTFSVSGGSPEASNVTTCFIYNGIKTSNYIASATSYKRGSNIIVKVKLARAITYSSIKVVSTASAAGISIDVAYDYNSTSDKNLVSATIQ